MQSSRERLLDAWSRSGMTLDELRVRAGLDVSRSSLSRKLRGSQAMEAGEVDALNLALGAGVRRAGSRAKIGRRRVPR